MVLGKVLIPNAEGVNLTNGLFAHYSFDTYINGPQHSDLDADTGLNSLPVSSTGALRIGRAGKIGYGVGYADLYSSVQYPIPLPSNGNSMAMSVWLLGITGTVNFKFGFSRLQIGIIVGVESVQVTITRMAWNSQLDTNVPYTEYYYGTREAYAPIHIVINGVTPYLDGVELTDPTIDDNTDGYPLNDTLVSSLNIEIDKNNDCAIDLLGIWNRQLNSLEIQALYNNGAGLAYLDYSSNLPNTFYSCTGGTITTSGNFKIHTFTTSGTFTVTSVGSVNNPIYAILIGGGGGAGKGSATTTQNAGGGGAGQFVSSLHYLTAGSYDATLGNGGLGSSVTTNKGANGQDTTFDGITAIGGGGGGSIGNLNGAVGGSGGGAAASGSSVGSLGNATKTSTLSSSHFGNFGRYATTNTAGGGGGAGVAATGTTGGAGVTIFGVEVAKGGNAHSNNANAAAGTGNGGNAASVSSGSNGGNGGRGRIVIYYKYQ